MRPEQPVQYLRLKCSGGCLLIIGLIVATGIAVETVLKTIDTAKKQDMVGGIDRIFELWVNGSEPGPNLEIAPNPDTKDRHPIIIQPKSITATPITNPADLK